jgi:hypothetical protein
MRKFSFENLPLDRFSFKTAVLLFAAVRVKGIGGGSLRGFLVRFSFCFEDSLFGSEVDNIWVRLAARGSSAAHTFFAGTKQASRYVGELNSVTKLVVLNCGLGCGGDVPGFCLAGSFGGTVERALVGEALYRDQRPSILFG